MPRSIRSVQVDSKQGRGTVVGVERPAGVDGVSGVSRLAQCFVVVVDDRQLLCGTPPFGAYLLSVPVRPPPARLPGGRRAPMSAVMSASPIDQHKFVSGVDEGDDDDDDDDDCTRRLCRI